jgi:FkbM family methyltransferase
MIDVGANVGDTIVACHQAPEDRFLAIEAHSFFVKDLRRNGAQIPNLVIVEALCSAEDSESTAVRLNSANGTAQVAGASTGRPIPRKKLDTIVSEHSEFSTCNFLKVDTDGSDFEVLRGSQDLIARARPVVYFECDVFDNEDYLDDFFQTMEFFKSVGYMSVVAYDNLGYLFQVFPVDQHEQFRQALEYQLLSKFGYFDLLVLDESCQDFVDLELTYFSRIIADRGKSP